MSRSVGVVIPAYRPDADVLENYVEAIATELEPETIRIEVDDPDPGLLKRLRELPAIVDAAPKRRGKGTAITAGFEQLQTDVLAFADADGSTHVGSLARVVDLTVAGTADLAVGSRRHPDATVRSHQTFARRRMGDALAWLARRMLDVQLYDYQCGAKALSSSAWKDLRAHLREPGFAWDIDLIAMAGALDLRVREVPVEWTDHPQSTVSPIIATWEFGRALVLARHRVARLRGSTVHEWFPRRWSDGPSLIDRLSEPRND